MIRFFALAAIGFLLLWAGLNTIRQITGGKRLIDRQSLAIAARQGSLNTWLALFVTVIGALVVAVSLFIFVGTLIILVFDPV